MSLLLPRVSTSLKTKFHEYAHHSRISPPAQAVLLPNLDRTPTCLCGTSNTPPKLHVVKLCCSYSCLHPSKWQLHSTVRTKTFDSSLSYTHTRSFYRHLLLALPSKGVYIQPPAPLLPAPAGSHQHPSPGLSREALYHLPASTATSPPANSPHCSREGLSFQT